MRLYWAFSLFFVLQFLVLSESTRKIDLEKFMNPEVYTLSLNEIENQFGLAANSLMPNRSADIQIKSTLFPEADKVRIRPRENRILSADFYMYDINPLIFVERLNEKYGMSFYSYTFDVIYDEGKTYKCYALFWETDNGIAIRVLYNNYGQLIGDKRIKRWVTSIDFSNTFTGISKAHKKLDDPISRQVAIDSMTQEDVIGAFFNNEERENAFSLSTDLFDQKYLKKFSCSWTDRLKISARSTAPLQFYQSKSLETLFNFRSGKLSKVILMFYNKGDQELNLPEKIFSKKLFSIKSSIENMTNVKAKFKPNAGIARNNLYWWITNNYFIKLEASFTKTSKTFSSNYIRLTLLPSVKGINAANVDKVNINSLSVTQLREMVVREPDGSVYIGSVPMVDQGQKGYCACAATARLLNYYGRDIDQHDLAKLAMTDKYGTSLEDLKKALSIISSKLRLHVQSVARCYLGSERDVKRFVKKIEAEYKKNSWVFKDPLKVSDLKQVFMTMSLRDQRYKDFKKGIKRSIDSGKPLVWALELGIIPEPEIPQADGGHMRLIIGYNEATDEIYYTDSWGAGHEKKSMDLKSAFWVSSAVWEVRPR